MRYLFSCFCLSLVALLAGCGTPPERRLDVPTLRVTDLDTTKSSYAVTIRLINTNTVPLVVKSSRHVVYFGDQKIGRVDDSQPIGVPPMGGVDHRFKLPRDLADDAKAWLDAHPGDITITIESALEIAVGEDDEMTLKTTGRGTIKR